VVHELVRLCQIGPSTQKPGIWPPKLANPFAPGPNAKTSLVFADVAYPCGLGPGHLSKTPLILSLVHVDWIGGSNDPRRCGPAAGGAGATRVRVRAHARCTRPSRRPAGAARGQAWCWCGGGSSGVGAQWPPGARRLFRGAAVGRGCARPQPVRGRRWWGTAAAAGRPSMTSEESVTMSDGGDGREELELLNLFV
jgi:hypothetical protein